MLAMQHELKGTALARAGHGMAYGLAGARVVNWRNIAIALTDTDFGEQKAQSGENAWLRKSSARISVTLQQPANWVQRVPHELPPVQSFHVASLVDQS